MNTVITSLRRGALALLLLLAALCFACGAQSDPSSENKTPGPIDLCASDVECGDALVCQSGLCTVPEPPHPRKIGFLFSPDPSSGLLPQKTPSIEVSPSQPLDFLLESSVLVRGDLSSADLRINGGTLVFAPQSEPEGVLRRQVSIDPMSSGFAIELIPGIYDITFISGDSELPNRRWIGKRISATTSLPLVLPPRSTITTVEGTLTHQDPTLDLDVTLNRIPVSGARVVAIAPDGTTSTSSVTDASGNFSIKVWADNGVHDLSISPSTPNGLVPTLLESDAFDATSGKAQTVALSLGTWSTQRVELRAELINALLERPVEADQLDFALDEARLVLQHTTEKSTITFNYDLASKEPLLLLPLPYQVTLIPPVSSRYKVLRFEWDASQTQRLPDLSAFTLQQKSAFMGQILDAAGEPVPEARVELRSLGAPEGKKTAREAAKDDPRQITLQSDERGAFSAWLDPRWAYDLVIAPPQTSNAPIGIYQIDPIASDRGEQTFALPAPLVIHGSVNRISEDQAITPQGNLSFELFDLVRDEPRVIAQGRTESDGSFRVLLPAE